MVSKAKLYSTLDALEGELKEALLPHLKDSVQGNNDLIFCVKAFNPFNELKNKTDKKTEELIEIGTQILALRKKLDEPSDGSIAERLCWYCRKWSIATKYQPLSGSILAKKFLSEVENNALQT